MKPVHLFIIASAILTTFSPAAVASAFQSVIRSSGNRSVQSAAGILTKKSNHPFLVDRRAPFKVVAATRSTTSLNMIQTKGLEKREEGATPLPGGMTLYIKAAEDGTSTGDCPFAHYIRMVLHEKSLDYDLVPSTQQTKPDWLIEHYEGKMPALRHRKECYVESDVITQYLDFFFQQPKLNPYGSVEMDKAKSACIDGFFPAVARYLKSTENGSEEDLALKANLESALGKIETQLSRENMSGSFLVGDGEQLTLLDCSLAPKLFHLSVGLKAFKDNEVDLETSFPKVKAYMDVVFDRDSFKDALYPEETVIWGWSNARK